MNRPESIGKWISALYRQIQIYINKELAPYNIGSGQIRVLNVIFKNEGINQESISKTLHCDKATIGRAINKLIKEGYVSRERDPNDRRSYVLHLTKNGKNLEPEIKKILVNITSILLTGFSQEEKEIALRSLKKMFQNVIS